MAGRNDLIQVFDSMPFFQKVAWMDTVRKKQRRTKRLRKPSSLAILVAISDIIPSLSRRLHR